MAHINAYQFGKDAAWEDAVDRAFNSPWFDVGVATGVTPLASGAVDALLAPKGERKKAFKEQFNRENLPRNMAEGAAAGAGLVGAKKLLKSLPLPKTKSQKFLHMLTRSSAAVGAGVGTRATLNKVLPRKEPKDHK